jgi:D-sedoheptulose 7-phosphate isomerase
MEESEMQQAIEELVRRYPILQGIGNEIEKAFEVLRDSYRGGGKLLVCGNGGSSSDADHIVGELMKSFVRHRPLTRGEKESLLSVDEEYGKRLADGLEGALPAINLSQHAALSSAFANDKDPVLGFAQQVEGYGRKGDVLLAISTSGNSANVILASVEAKAKGMSVIALTGEKKAKIDPFGDVLLKVPETETFKIQELHLPIYHALCMALEAEFWA